MAGGQKKFGRDARIFQWVPRTGCALFSLTVPSRTCQPFLFGYTTYRIEPHFRKASRPNFSQRSSRIALVYQSVWSRTIANQL